MAFEFLKKLKVPHVLTLLTMIIFVCSLLTYVVPSGTYERKIQEVDGRNREVVIAGSYQEMPKHITLKSVVVSEKKEDHASPVSIRGFLTAIPRGMQEVNDIIFFIFIIGGALAVLRSTGVITASIHELIRIFDGKPAVLTIVIMFAVGVGGSTLGMGEEFIPLVPIFLMISASMGYDRIYGMAIVILAAQVGFASAITNPFTVGVAQGVAELPIGSGKEFRIVFFLVCMSITIAYLLRYGAKVKKDPSLSLVAGDEAPAVEVGEKEAFTSQHAWILITGIVIFALILYGVSKWGWWMADMGGGFLLIAMIAIAISRMPLAKAVKSFVQGLEEMVVAALVVGFAKGIEVVLTDGNIMDSVIFYASNLLTEVPKVIAVQGMFIFQTGLNFLIPSGSGQATVTMPIMAPLADVLGITRQTAVFAFQCGDGFSNLIIPTSVILMSMLGIAKIPYEKWLRFMLPLLGLLWLASAVFLAIAVMIGYS